MATSSVSVNSGWRARSAQRCRPVATVAASGCALLCIASTAYADKLFERDDILLTGTARVVTHGAAMCRGTEEQYSGQPLDIWRLDYSVVNGSSRRLASLTAQVRITAAPPPCQQWSELSGRYEAHGKAKPVLWGDNVHMLQRASGMASKKKIRDAVFVLVPEDDQPSFGSVDVSYRFPDPKCEEPTPLACSDSGRWRVDPTILLISGRYTFDGPPDPPDEIQPFEHGAVNFEVNLAGIEAAVMAWKNRLRFGVNGSFGITRYNDAGLFLLSVALFGQVKNLYRVEYGWMHATSGHDDLTGSAADKSAWFVGVSFPHVSDQIRKLAEKLK